MRLAGRLALSHSAALAAGLLAAALLPSAGCLLSLPSVCGDGQVDIEGGEECDPAAASEPLCDPESCTKIILEKCGNATIDPGEQCDLTAFGNKDCPSGKGFLSCPPDCKLDESTCDQCGNGRIDPEAGEECDPKAGSFMQPKDCSELTTYPMKPYTSGRMTTCTEKCRWYRGPCGFCGDEEADDPQLLDINYPDQLSKRETCDGEDVQLEDLTNYCTEVRGCPNSMCAVECLNTCDGFVAEDDARCCLPAGSDCPVPGKDPCCYAYDHELDDLYATDACADRFESGGLKKRVCKSH